MDNKTLGKIGEDIAAKFLMRRGYKILHQNWRCRIGEIDIVAAENDFLVFVEIKTRSDLSFGPPCLAVNHFKQLKLIRLAHIFLKRYGQSDRPCRIDIVSIVVDERNKPKNIELIKDAFWEREAR